MYWEIFISKREGGRWFYQNPQEKKKTKYEKITMQYSDSLPYSFLPAYSSAYSAHTHSEILLSFFIIIDVEKGVFV